MAAHQPAGRRRLVGRVVVDVDLRVSREPVHHQIDRLLESPLLGLARDLTQVVDSPEGVKGGLAVRLDQTRLKDPEQVFHAVVQRERIAFDVEEEITRPRRRQACEATVGFQIAVGQPA